MSQVYTAKAAAPDPDDELPDGWPDGWPLDPDGPFPPGWEFPEWPYDEPFPPTNDGPWPDDWTPPGWPDDEDFPGPPWPDGWPPDAPPPWWADQGWNVYVVDGYDGDAFLQSLYEYDIATDTWEVKTSALEQAAHGRCTFTGQKNGGFMIGGAADDDDPDPFKKAMRYTPDEWSIRTSNMNHPRQGHAAFLESASEKIVRMGGLDDALDTIAESETYTPAGDVWTENAPMGALVYRHDSCEANGIGWLCGGFVGGDPGASDNMYQRDPADETWAVKAGKPSAGRWDATLLGLNNVPHFIGGESTSNVFVDLNEAYDIAGDVWAQKTKMLSPKRAVGHQGTTTNASDGWITSGEAIGGIVKHHHKYDQTTDTWSKHKEFTIGKRRIGASCGIQPAPEIPGQGGTVYRTGGDQPDAADVGPPVGLSRHHELLNLTDESWKEKAAIGTDQYWRNMGSGTIGEAMYIFGGDVSDGGAATTFGTNRTMKYTPEQNSWGERDTLNTARSTASGINDTSSTYCYCTAAD